MAERLALPTSDHGVTGSNPAGGEILPEPKRRFIAQSLSCLPFHRLEMTEILSKGRKTLTHPSIHLINLCLIDKNENCCISSFLGYVPIINLNKSKNVIVVITAHDTCFNRLSTSVKFH